MLWGPSGASKSFLLVDWALCLATGTPWLGRAVAQCRVLYVAAEGGNNFGKRLAVWLARHGIDRADNLRVIKCDVQFISEVDHFLSAIKEFRPSVVIVDPFADCFVDYDENQAKDQSKFIQTIKKIKRVVNGTYILAHHTGWETNRERGSNRMRNHADVVIAVRAGGNEDREITVSNTKQRDADKFEPIHLDRINWDTERSEGWFESCVLSEPSGSSETARPALSKKAVKALKALAAFPSGAAESGDWESTADVGKNRTFHNYRDALLKGGHIALVGRGSYRVTELGQQALSTATAKLLQIHCILQDEQLLQLHPLL